MRAEAELREIAIAMAKDLGEAYGHIKTAERSVERALSRLSKEEVAQLDARTALGGVIERIMLNAMRASLPLMAADVAISDTIESETSTPVQRMILLSDTMEGTTGAVIVAQPEIQG
jgi:hypothetical protein